MVHNRLFAFTAATSIKESAFVEKLKHKPEFSYSQTATIIIKFLFEVLLTQNYSKPIETH